MKIKTIIDLIKTYDNKGIETEEYVLSNRFIYNEIILNRGYLLSQKLENNMFVEPYKQTINCIKLIEVPRIDCDCLLGIDSLCKILRTEYPIPKYIGDTLSVTSVDGRMNFQKTTKEKLTYAKGNRYTAYNIKWFIENNYIYVASTSSLKGISVTSYFFDPIEVYNLSLCNNTTNCLNILELDLYMQEEDLTQILQAVNSTLGNLKYISPDDTFDKKDTSFTTYTDNPFKRYQSKK